ncbi:MAG TPA: AMP-binding protein, partial [Gemmatimonadaceae bacterium]|nr:AMP-binding protein [Gemmatimonadaceae bacterium]
MMIARGGQRPEPGTLTKLFFDAVERFDKPDALQVKIGGRYEPISHRVLAERVRRVAGGLQQLGVTPGDRVAILSENRPEWAIADFACLTARLTDVAIYPTLPAQQIAYILKDSGAVAVFVSTREQARKVAEIRGGLPGLRHVIGFDDMGVGGDVDVQLLALEERGREGETAASAAAFRDEALRVQPDDVATLIYTSGTTGEPKGVMLTHDNLFSNVTAALHLIEFTGRDIGLSFLPLSHIFERMAGHYLMFATGTSIA